MNSSLDCNEYQYLFCHEDCHHIQPKHKTITTTTTTNHLNYQGIMMLALRCATLTCLIYIPAKSVRVVVYSLFCCCFLSYCCCCLESFTDFQLDFQLQIALLPHRVHRRLLRTSVCLSVGRWVGRSGGGLSVIPRRY